MTQEILKLPSRCAVDHNPTFSVNQRYLLLKLIQEDCWAAPEICSLIFGVHMVRWQTFFCKFTCVLFEILSHNTRPMGWPNCGEDSCEFKHGATRRWKWWSRQRHNSCSEISMFVNRKFIQPHGLVFFWRILGSTNNEFKSRNFILTNSVLHKRFRVGG